MKKNLCFFIVSILLSINSNAQDVTTDSTAILDSIRNAGTKVKILYVPPPKEEPQPKEFYSVQLGAFFQEIPDSNFDSADNVYHIVNEEEIYVYLSGEFDELNDAIRERSKLTKKGQSSIYVVRVIDKRTIVLIE